MNHHTPSCIGVLTSGGDAPGMNAAVRAVVRAASYHGLRTVGIRYGYRGLMEGELFPLGPRDVAGIVQRGGTILNTSRSEEFKTSAGRTRALAALRKHGVDSLVVIGGDGSFRGAFTLHEESGMPVAAIPGTIDNDVAGTQFTIGFDSAVNIAMEAIDRLRDTAAAIDRIFVVEVMGRRCGAIALATAVAGGAEEILVPEDPNDDARLRTSIQAARDRNKRSMIVVVAEGDATGGALAVSEALQGMTDLQVRATILGHVQRGGSPTAADRLLAARMGVRAVDALVAGERAFMVHISGGIVGTRPIADAWAEPRVIDAELARLVGVLSQ